MKKKLVFFFLTALFSLSACQEQGKLAKNQTFSYAEDHEVTSIDPQKSKDLPGLNIINNSFEGLYGLNKKGKVESLGASALPKKVNETTYEISLNKKSKWSDGSKVTAEDYLRGFERGTKEDAPYRELFRLFKNGEEVLTGQKAFSEIGIKALDETTLQLTLAKEEKELARLLTLPVFYPVAAKNIEKENSFEKSSNLLYNGPFELKNFNRKESFAWTFVPNTHYWNKEKVKIKKIDGMVKLDNDMRLSQYNQGKTALMPIRQLPGKDITQDPEYLEKNYYQTGYFKYNPQSTVLKDKTVRKVIYYATNREEEVKWALTDNSKPTLNVLPQIKEALPTKWETEKFDFDKEKAGNIYEEKILDLPKGTKNEEIDLTKIPHLTFNVLTSNEPEQRRLAESLQYSLERLAPGIRLNIESVSPEEVAQKELAGDYDLVAKQSLPMVDVPYWEAVLLAKDLFQSADELPETKVFEFVEKNWVQTYQINPLYQKKTSYLISSRVKGIQINEEGPLVSFKNSYRVN